MTQYSWFTPIQSMFYQALEYYELPYWNIKAMPHDVNTHRGALVQAQRTWPFRTHNARAKFKCRLCGKRWISAYTTVIWRARRNTNTIQITIEKQGCQRCNIDCQGRFVDEDEIGFALDWMCTWIWDVFYGIRDETVDEDEGNDDPEDIEEPTAPHDYQRCQAGRKGTCRKCNARKQRHDP